MSPTDRPAAKRPRPLADLIGASLGPALAAQGFTGADIVASWPSVVGERLAAASEPLRVDWPRRVAGSTGSEPATLVVRVEGAFALELQHMAPLVVERVNSFYGWRCIGRLVLKQGPVGRRRRKPSNPPAQPTPAQQKAVAGAVSGVAEPSLQAALTRLGEAVAATGTDTKDEAGTPAP